MKIILHAGTHKTGTTGFQTALRRHAVRLQASGTSILVTPRQAHAGAPAKFEPQWLRARANAARADGMARLVLSHEVISVLSTDELEVLMSALDGTDFRYVVAFRHWTSFLPSRWRQNCRRRDAQSFRRFMSWFDACHPDKNPFDFASIPMRARAAGITDLRLLSWDDDGEGALGLLHPLWRACDLEEAGLPATPNGLSRLLAGRGGANRSGAPEIEDRVRLFNFLRARDAGLAENALFDRLCGIGPEPDFFDQGEVVERALKNDPALWREIDAKLSSASEEVTLVPEQFEVLARRLDAVTMSETGRQSFFSDPRPVRVRSSAIEGDALPVELISRMRRAVQAAAPRQARYEAGRARVLRLRERLLRF
jgi:hypothetical protein